MVLKKDFYRVGEVLKDFMSKNSKIGSIIKQNSVFLLWDEVVESDIKEMTEPISIKGGTLYVRTNSSVLANELAFQEVALKSKINNRIGEPIIKRIVFKTGQVFKKKDNTKKEIIVKKQLSKNTTLKIKEVCKKISDPELQLIMEKFLKQIAVRRDKNLF